MEPQPQVNFPIPYGTALRAAASLLAGRRRSFREDARREVAGLDPPLQVAGGEQAGQVRELGVNDSTLGQRGERRGRRRSLPRSERGARGGQLHRPLRLGGVLIEVEDVGAVPEEERGDGRDEAGTVQALDQEDGARLGHGREEPSRGRDVGPLVGPPGGVPVQLDRPPVRGGERGAPRLSRLWVAVGWQASGRSSAGSFHGAWRNLQHT